MANNEKSAQPVDVRAVMDSAAQHAATLRTYARDTGAFRVTNAGASALAEACAAALAAIEARAAVAELVEDLKRIQRRAAPHPDDDDADRKRNLYHVESISRRALARVQGGAA